MAYQDGDFGPYGGLATLDRNGLPLPQPDSFFAADQGGGDASAMPADPSQGKGPVASASAGADPDQLVGQIAQAKDAFVNATDPAGKVNALWQLGSLIVAASQQSQQADGSDGSGGANGNSPQPAQPAQGQQNAPQGPDDGGADAPQRSLPPPLLGQGSADDGSGIPLLPSDQQNPPPFAAGLPGAPGGSDGSQQPSALSQLSSGQTMSAPFAAGLPGAPGAPGNALPQLGAAQGAAAFGRGPNSAPSGSLFNAGATRNVDGNGHQSQGLLSPSDQPNAPQPTSAVYSRWDVPGVGEGPLLALTSGTRPTLMINEPVHNDGTARPIFLGPAPAREDRNVARYLIGNRGPTQKYSSAMGVPGSAVEGVIGEEMRNVGPMESMMEDGALNSVYGESRWFDNGNPNATILHKYNENRDAIEKGLPIGGRGWFGRGWAKLVDENVLAQDVGPGNINFGEAIRLLKVYDKTYPKADPLDLKKYNSDLVQYYNDLRSSTGDTPIKVAALKVRNVIDTFSNNRYIGPVFKKLSGRERDAAIDAGYRTSLGEIEARVKRGEPIYKPRDGKYDYFRDSRSPYDYAPYGPLTKL